MRRLTLVLVTLALASRATAATTAVSGSPLTVDDAVKIALQHNSQIVQSDVTALTAKSGMWSAYSGILPRVSASASRSGGITKRAPVSRFDAESYTTTGSLTGSWNVGDLSAWTGWSSARQGMRSAEFGRASTRADVVLATKRQFYTVVQAMHLAVVNAQALRLARDSERRVRAMYEVGSVSKSDLLKAQVATSQAALDSLTSAHDVTNQHILLSQALGLPDEQVAEVDSVLSFTVMDVSVDGLLADARRQRPDLKAADAEVHGAELGLRSAHWNRLPYLSLSGGWTPDTRTDSKSFGTSPHSGAGFSSVSESKGSVSGEVALNMDLFDGLATDAKVASARGKLLQARETRDALLRNLEGQVRQAVLAYQESVERFDLATRTVESASENQNLVQQKYNVGSATILDLIDSQVQLQRAQSTLVSAQAAIRMSEAQMDQVRGRTQ